MPASANPQLAPPSSAAGADGLNVIALVSGGKDSFFSLLHCLANGHRVVALANLHPQVPAPGTQGRRSGGPGTDAFASATTVLPPSASATEGIAPVGGSHPQVHVLVGREGRDAHQIGPGEGVDEGDVEEQDLNSFMYQTVGHEVIPLYAEATGIPLYRQPITGGAAHNGKDYAHYEHVFGITGVPGSAGLDGIQPISVGELGVPQGATTATPAAADATPVPMQDETESMVPLLLAIKAAHPEANAVSAGAILSTYQRTRVESVAARLGLTPLAYLWKFPVLPLGTDSSASAGSPLPAPSVMPDPLADAQLLRDMAAVGLDARLVKVATGGLDESFLWTNLATSPGMARVARGMRRFMAAEPGAVLGEGGEFETLVVDGPSTLFRKRIVVEEPDRRIVREGGNNAWLRIRAAKVVEKGEQDATDAAFGAPRRPALLDPRFADVLKTLSREDIDSGDQARPAVSQIAEEMEIPKPDNVCAASRLIHWCVAGDASSRSSIEAETRSLVENVRSLLRQTSMGPEAIVATTIILRSMADFPKVNGIYGRLFTAPNPPSRVTISCGDQLSKDANIVVYLTVHPGLGQGQRKGLHVQSRSYWAPANIGPYSQSISVPLGTVASADPVSSGAELVFIAGQIPLVPMSMEFPAGPNAFELELALSLQHLWRIGIDVGVQWWSSGVAFFPRSGSEAMPGKARLAARAWETAHLWSAVTGPGDNDEDAEGDGPDLWDRRYNAAYMSFGAEKEATPPSLPDWSVVAGVVEEDERPVPPFFAAEVEELPRSAGVEWQAHGGFAHLAEKSVRCSRRVIKGDGTEECYSVVVEYGKRSLLAYQVYSWNMEAATKHRQQETPGKLLLLDRTRERLTAIGIGQAVPVVQYFDSSLFEMPAYGSSDVAKGVPAVPCFSLWNSHGERLGLVVVCQSVLSNALKTAVRGENE